MLARGATVCSMSSSSWHRRPVHPGKRPNRLVFNLTVSEQRIATIFSPAKINLFLAVTGLRTDGFHDLVSVAAPLHFGDQLIAVVDSGERNSPAQFSLECDVPDVPVDGSNLVLKAAAAFAAATGWGESVAFRLEKRIPVGAGLGGGSSNATAALLALNQLSGADLDRATLGALAAAVGSDCPLFLGSGPVIMRGRGEQIEPLPQHMDCGIGGRGGTAIQQSGAGGLPEVSGASSLAGSFAMPIRSGAGDERERQRLFRGVAAGRSDRGDCRGGPRRLGRRLLRAGDCNQLRIGRTNRPGRRHSGMAAGRPAPPEPDAASLRNRLQAGSYSPHQAVSGAQT